MKLFAEKLKQLRVEKNWSQQYVADKLKITRGCWSHWENGRTEPSLKEIINIANLFNCNLENLIIPTNEIESLEVGYQQYNKDRIQEIKNLASNDIESELLEKCTKLNDKNQKKVLEITNMYLSNQEDYFSKR